MEYQYYKNKRKEYVPYNDAILTRYEQFGYGDPKAAGIVNQIIKLYSKNSDDIFRILGCYAIKGFKLVRLVNSCCEGNLHNFETTLAILSCNKIDSRVVSKSLNLKKPIPFVSKEVLQEFNNVSLNELLTDAKLRNKLSAEAETISATITPVIEAEYKKYIENLQLT